MEILEKVNKAVKTARSAMNTGEAIGSLADDIDSALRRRASVCPSCRKKTNLGTKFCQNCGFLLMPSKCKCGSKNPAGAKFCGKCGGKLANV